MKHYIHVFPLKYLRPTLLCKHVCGFAKAADPTKFANGCKSNLITCNMDPNWNALTEADISGIIQHILNHHTSSSIEEASRARFVLMKNATTFHTKSLQRKLIQRYEDSSFVPAMAQWNLTGFPDNEFDYIF